jgi:hypothetical protein
VVTVRVISVVRVKLPDVPVMVTVNPPLIALLLAATIKMLVPVVLAGVKKAFTPLGKPDAVKLTLPVKPFCGVTVIVLARLDPCARFRLFGEAERVKLGVAFTVRLIVVVLVKLPEVPVIVTVAVPAAAVPLAESVKLLVVKVLLGVKEAVTPTGKPDTDKLTLPEKAPVGVTVIVLLPLAPCTRVMLLGEADSVKP